MKKKEFLIMNSEYKAKKFLLLYFNGHIKYLVEIPEFGNLEYVLITIISSTSWQIDVGAESQNVHDGFRMHSSTPLLPIHSVRFGPLCVNLYAT